MKRSCRRSWPGAGARCALFLLILFPARPLAAQGNPPRARFAFGSLGGKRQMAQGSNHIYYLTPRGELRIVEKLGQPGPPAAPPSGGEAPLPSPKLVGTLKLEGIPEALEWIDDRTLCVGTGNYLALVNVAEPASPRLLREVPVAEREIDGVSEMKRMDGVLYLAARRQGLVRLDLTDPGSPARRGALPLRGLASSLDIQGDLAVVATGVGLALVRIAGETLRLERAVDTLRRAEVVRLFGQRLVFCSKEYTVFYDLSDPGAPVELGEVSSRDPFFHSHHAALELTPSLAYVAATEGGLYIYDWREPGAPRLLIQHSFWGNERRLTLEKKLEYLEAQGVAGSREELARSLPRAENALIPAVGMTIDGNRVYLTDYQGKLWALEVRLDADPSARCVLREN